MNAFPHQTAPVNLALLAVASLVAWYAQHEQASGLPTQPPAVSQSAEQIPGLIRRPSSGLNWTTEVWVAGAMANRRRRELCDALGERHVHAATGPDRQARWLRADAVAVVITVIRYPATLAAAAPAPSKPKPRIARAKFVGMGEVA